MEDKKKIQEEYKRILRRRNFHNKLVTRAINNGLLFEEYARLTDLEKRVIDEYLYKVDAKQGIYLYADYLKLYKEHYKEYLEEVL